MVIYRCSAYLVSNKESFELSKVVDQQFNFYNQQIALKKPVNYGMNEAAGDVKLLRFRSKKRVKEKDCRNVQA